MNNSRCWTDGLSFREQYDACWIMGNYDETAKYIKEHPAFSLLPIRFYNDGDWNLKGLYNFSSVGTYRDGFELCRTSEICSSKIEFAYQLWEKAAALLVMEFPDIEEISYGEQNENGVPAEAVEQALIAFLDEVFFIDDEPETKRDFISILPKIYHDEYRPAYNNFVVQDEDGEFRAAVGNFNIDLDVCGEKIKACCIGNVAVGLKYRSMGYMVDLMEMSVEEMMNNGTDLAYLGGQRQRYGYFGFEASGVSYNFEFNKKTAKHIFGGRKSNLRVERLQENDTEALSAIIDEVLTMPECAKADATIEPIAPRPTMATFFAFMFLEKEPLP